MAVSFPVNASRRNAVTVSGSAVTLDASNREPTPSLHRSGST
nr:hypothetical protein [Haloprofundus halobius]